MQEQEMVGRNEDSLILMESSKEVRQIVEQDGPKLSSKHFIPPIDMPGVINASNS